MSKDRESDIDKRIREALYQEDAKMFAELNAEQSLQGMMIESFRGRKKWLVLLATSWMLVFFGLAVYAGFLHFGGEELRYVLFTQTALLLFVGALTALKTWYFMELNKNTMSREIKRLELEISLLAKKLRADAG